MKIGQKNFSEKGTKPFSQNTEVYYYSIQKYLQPYW